MALVLPVKVQLVTCSEPALEIPAPVELAARPFAIVTPVRLSGSGRGIDHARGVSSTERHREHLERTLRQSDAATDAEDRRVVGFPERALRVGVASRDIRPRLGRARKCGDRGCDQ